jgi:hypothetical protein
MYQQQNRFILMFQTETIAFLKLDRNAVVSCGLMHKSQKGKLHITVIVSAPEEKMIALHLCDGGKHDSRNNE